MSQRRHQVSIVRVSEQNTHGALEEAIALIGGIDDLVSPDSSTLMLGKSKREKSRISAAA